MKMWQKLFLGFVTVITIVAIEGYICIHLSQKELQKNIEETSASLASEILDSINANFDRRIEAVQENSKSSTIQQAASESNKEFEKLDNIQTYINEKDREWTSAPQKETTPFMQEIIGNEVSEELRNTIGFYEKKYHYKVFNEFIITNKYGANIAQTGKTTDYYQADEQWWQDAKKEGLYIEDVEYDESADVYATSIGVRIDDQSGNFSGVIKAVLNIDDTIKSLAGKKHLTEFKLLTKDKKIIYSTEEFEFLQDLPIERTSCPVGQETPEHAHYFISEDDHGEEGYALYAYVHSEKHGDYKNLGWILLIEYKTEEIFASVSRLRNLLLFILLIFIVFAVLMGLFISYSIYRPLVNLSKALVRIGEGKLDTKVTIKSRDEIGFLANSINKMTEDLKQTQSQLVQSEKLASIGQLAAGVAHEMNTPVGFVAGNFQTLERHVKKILDLLAMHDKLAGQAEDSGDPQLKTVVEGIGQFREDTQIDFILEDIQRLFVDSKEGVSRTVKIIQNLRDFSRIDQPGSRDEYDLNEGIKATLVMAKNEIKYDADVETDLSELPPIYCHCGQINQVLLNILVNAAQAIKSQEREDRGTITIRTYASDDAVVCEISDDGPGIPPDNISKIYDPFFTTKPPGKGTGLGLNIAYDIIVNKHNGKLLVDSTVGVGTKFTIKLPIGTKENEEEKEIINDRKEDSVSIRQV
jgi:signal transduction histidine kinase